MNGQSVLGELFKDLEERLKSGESFEQVSPLLFDIQNRSLLLESDKNLALINYITSKTSVNKKREGKSQIDFDNWQRMITDPLKKEAGATRSSFFRFVMDQMLDQKPGFKKVPFFYYDFNSEKAVYTPGVLGLFKIDQKASEKIPLKVIVRRFVAEDERKFITDELKFGNRIKDYKLKTSYTSLNEVIVNAYPLIYEKKPVGFGVLLYSPEINSRISKQRYEIFEKSVEELIGKVAREFEIIKDGPKKIK
jgi:hypothetical protein